MRFGSEKQKRKLMAPWMRCVGQLETIVFWRLRLVHCLKMTLPAGIMFCKTDWKMNLWCLDGWTRCMLQITARFVYNAWALYKQVFCSWHFGQDKCIFIAFEECCVGCCIVSMRMRSHYYNTAPLYEWLCLSNNRPTGYLSFNLTRYVAPRIQSRKCRKVLNISSLFNCRFVVSGRRNNDKEKGVGEKPRSYYLSFICL